MNIQDHRALDLLVAKQIMRYRFVKKRSGNKKYPFMYRWESPDNEPVFHPGGGLFGWGWSHTPYPAPKFSSQLDLAFAVVEVMSLRGYTVLIGLSAKKLWDVTFFISAGGIGRRSYSVNASLPLAICLAATEALALSGSKPSRQKRRAAPSTDRTPKKRAASRRAGPASRRTA